MAAFMQGFRSQTYALLRIVTGFLFLFHGSQKLLDWPLPAHAGTPVWIQYGAGSIELIGGMLVMIGLLTRWSAFVSSGCMAIAYWLAHGSQALFPVANGGDLAIMYCFVFLFIAAEGPGIWSIDGLRGR